MSICTPQMGSVGLGGGKKETGGEAESWLQWLQEEPKASSSWPHLLQLCPSCPQHSILIAKGHKLKVPEETWPSLTKKLRGQIQGQTQDNFKPMEQARTEGLEGPLSSLQKGPNGLRQSWGTQTPCPHTFSSPLHCCPDLGTQPGGPQELLRAMPGLL